MQQRVEQVILVLVSACESEPADDRLTTDYTDMLDPIAGTRYS